MEYLKTKIIASTLLLAIISALLINSIFTKEYNRYLMFFKNSITAKPELEVRYLQKQNIEPDAVYFFKDLMLGPVNHQNYLFLNPEEKVISCFLRKDSLYADLPSSFLDTINFNFQSNEIENLFEKNIFNNFNNIKSVYIYCNGKLMYKLSKNHTKN